MSTHFTPPGTGIIVVAIFPAFKWPLPVPPVFAGIFGISPGGELWNEIPNHFASK